jgi:predicted metal-dependent peptidase
MIEDSISIAKLGLMQQANTTFFAYFAMNVAVHVSDKLPTAWTNGLTIGVNPDFWKANANLRKSILLHEMLHIIYKHHARLLGRDPSKANRAMDYVINDHIKKLSMPIGSDWLYNSDYEGMAWEEIYELLPDTPSDNNPLAGDMQPMEGTAETLASTVDDMLVRAATQAAAANQAGSIPADLQLRIDNLINPKLPWQQLLRKYVGGKAKNDYSIRRPNKRFIPMYAPSLLSEGIGDIAVAFDTSGSVSESQFRAGLSETHFVLAKLKPTNIDFYQFDHGIRSMHKIKTAGALLSIPFVGGGGTCVVDVLTAYKKSNAKVMVFITDGYFNTDLVDPKKPVIWIIYGNAAWVAPFGTAVHVKEF